MALHRQFAGGEPAATLERLAPVAVLRGLA